MQTLKIEIISVSFFLLVNYLFIYLFIFNPQSKHLPETILKTEAFIVSVLVL